MVQPVDGQTFFGDGGVPFGNSHRVRSFVVSCWAGFAAETIYLQGRRHFFCAAGDIKLLRSVTPIVERMSRGVETAGQVERDLLADTFRFLWRKDWWDDVVMIAGALQREGSLDGARVAELLAGSR